MAAPIFVIGAVARKAIEFATRKAAEAFVKSKGKGSVVQGLKNIGKRIKTSIDDIQKELGEDAITKDEAIVSGAVLGAYPIHKMQQKKEEKKSIMELETNASQKAKNNN